ncbi:MAG: APC family permease [Candidatus Acidiferrales bacterium]
MGPPAKLERGLGLAEASALNMIDMVGIGPFIVIPIVIRDMGGPQCMLAWFAGAVVSLLDGCVWAELGAAMPEAGGSYVYLREAYGAAKRGRLLSFLLIWQTILQAPLVMASGSIGFAEYFSYLVPLGKYGQKAVAGGVVLVLLVLLYRRIGEIGKISVLLWAGVIGTIVWLIVAGATHFHREMAFDFPAGAFHLHWLFFAGLGSATVQTIYCYLGYDNVCFLGGEVKNPEKNIPRSIFISIVVIAALYLVMQLCVLGVVPWREAQNSEHVVSSFFERIYGPHAAVFATVLILWVAFASLFSLTLGYSRIPYAAAQDGNFFSVFGRVHPTKHFPHVSLVALCAVALPFSLLFRLQTVIAAILAMRILIQFVSQAIGVILLRRRWSAERIPFKMWLYPLPAIFAGLLWLAVFAATGIVMVYGTLAILAGGIVYLGRARRAGEWPFGKAVAR